MKKTQQLRTTNIKGMTVSSIFVPVADGGYFETMLFTNGQRVEGLANFETCEESVSWEDNHAALVAKVEAA